MRDENKMCRIYVVVYLPCGHKVVEVVGADKGLDLALLLQLLLSHLLGDFSWVSLDTSDESVSVFAVIGSLIVVLVVEGKLVSYN